MSAAVRYAVHYFPRYSRVAGTIRYLRDWGAGMVNRRGTDTARHLLLLLLRRWYDCCERLSPQDIRASSQALLLFVTNGFGMLVGHLVSGRVHEYFADPAGGHAWAKIFMVPIVITVYCCRRLYSLVR